jgi:hypothetical protein
VLSSLRIRSVLAGFFATPKATDVVSALHGELLFTETAVLLSFHKLNQFPDLRLVRSVKRSSRSSIILQSRSQGERSTLSRYDILTLMSRKCLSSKRRLVEFSVLPSMKLV